MWGQLISTRVKAGKESELPKLYQQLEAAEPGNSGLVRSMAFRDQKDPSRLHMLVLFQSEEHARAREADEQRQQQLEGARATMADMFDGPPEFTDLEVVYDFTP